MLCMQGLLSRDDSNLHTRNRKDRKFDKACQDEIYESEYDAEVPGLHYNHMAPLPFKKRVCKIYDFKRRLGLFETQNETRDFRRR